MTTGAFKISATKLASDIFRVDATKLRILRHGFERPFLINGPRYHHGQ